MERICLQIKISLKKVKRYIHLSPLVTMLWIFFSFAFPPIYWYNQAQHLKNLPFCLNKKKYYSFSIICYQNRFLLFYLFVFFPGYISLFILIYLRPLRFHLMDFILKSKKISNIFTFLMVSSGFGEIYFTLWTSQRSENGWKK